MSRCRDVGKTERQAALGQAGGRTRLGVIWLPGGGGASREDKLSCAGWGAVGAAEVPLSMAGTRQEGAEGRGRQETRPRPAARMLYAAPLRLFRFWHAGRAVVGKKPVWPGAAALAGICTALTASLPRHKHRVRGPLLEVEALGLEVRDFADLPGV